MAIKLSTSDRYAFIGKTRSGKTFATTALCALLLPWQYPAVDANGKKRKKPWQIWWVETKGAGKDIGRLYKWGFRPASAAPDDWPRLLFKVRAVNREDELSVSKQVQALCWRASDRGNVILVIDEYVSVCHSSRSTGAGLKNVFQRGGGLHCGLIGGTQEPVGIPRQLVSQATHAFLLNVTYQHDVDWCNELCPSYGEGPPDPYGFWYRWLDGPKNLSKWTYFHGIGEFIGRTRPELTEGETAA